MVNIDVREESIVNAIQDIITRCGGEKGSFTSDLVTQMIQTCLKLMIEGHDIGKLKLINRAIREMRHAYHVFNKYPDAPRVSIFGSARTPEHHPDYIVAENFAKLMVKEGWMCITGAAEGIMRAGIQGAESSSSFGLSIHLPKETTANDLIEGDPKLMMFRYFFTRKLMFLSQASAVAAFPGGYGTLDELFEVLTLMQTGKSSILPLVLIEGKGSYWEHWKEYVDAQLLGNGWISKSDEHLYHIAHTAEEAKQHIMNFYRVYHSSRYVNDIFVIRLKKPLHERQVAFLNEKFQPLLASGQFSLSTALPEENEYLELPRLIFPHHHRQFGLLRSLIDHINKM